MAELQADNAIDNKTSAAANAPERHGPQGRILPTPATRTPIQSAVCAVGGSHHRPPGQCSADPKAAGAGAYKNTAAVSPRHLVISFHRLSSEPADAAENRIGHGSGYAAILDLGVVSASDHPICRWIGHSTARVFDPEYDACEVCGNRAFRTLIGKASVVEKSGSAPGAGYYVASQSCCFAHCDR